MDQLDLDIQNYSIKDLEKFFRLKPKSIYSADDIDQKEYQIREQLLKSGHINPRFKHKLIEFLGLAKQWLIQVKCEPVRVPTVIPKNHILDKYNNVPRSEELPTSRMGDLIQRPEIPYVFTQNSEFVPGTLNQLNTRVITKCLNIDTRYRNNLYSTQSSDFIIQMPIKFNKVVSMQLASLDFPVAFYGISATYGNNYFTMGIQYNSYVTAALVDASMTIVIPDGNYNAVDFISELNALLQMGPVTTDMSGSSVFAGVKMTLSLSQNGSGTGKVTINTYGIHAANIQSISLDFGSDINGQKSTYELSSKIGWNMGFIKPYYSGKTIYVSDTVMEPVSIRYIYLVVDDFQNSSSDQFVNVFQNSILNTHILARISIKSAYFNLIMENDFKIVTEPRTYFGPVDIQRLHIKVLDDHGRILNMNNSNFAMCLTLKMLYDV